MTTADLTKTCLATTDTSGGHPEPEVDNTELLGSLTQLDDLLADGSPEIDNTELLDSLTQLDDLLTDGTVLCEFIRSEFASSVERSQ